MGPILNKKQMTEEDIKYMMSSVTLLHRSKRNAPARRCLPTAHPLHTAQTQ
mgnify:CR=1 FL=1